MQPLKPRDYPKVAVYNWNNCYTTNTSSSHMKISKISIAKLIMAGIGLTLVGLWLFSDYIF